MNINMTHLQKLRVTGSNGISKLDDGDIEVAFYPGSNVHPSIRCKCRRRFMFACP